MKPVNSYSINMPRVYMLSFFIMLLGCYESKDACIDSRAINYDVSGDENCCCEYPNLSLGVGYFYENDPFRTSQTFYRGDDSFKITSLDILISEVALINSGDSSRIDSTIVMPLLSSASASFIDDFTHLRLTVNSSKIGRFMFVDTFDTIHFTIGLNNARNIDPDDINSAHPLHPDNSGWEENDGYPFMRMTLLRGEAFQDTIQLSIFENLNSLPVSLKLYDGFKTEKGQNVIINLEFDISEWIKDVDIIFETPDKIAEGLYYKIPDVVFPL